MTAHWQVIAIGVAIVGYVVIREAVTRWWRAR